MKLAVLGGTGVTGREFTRLALEAGHEVRALVREASRLEPAPGLTLLVGNARDAAQIAELVRGVDAVVSLIGPRPDDRTVCSAVTELVLAAMRTHGVRRYILVSGAAVQVAGDRKTFVDRLFDRLVRRIERGGVEDRERELALLEASDLDWTALRVPRLDDAPAGGRASLAQGRPPAKRLGRAELARHLLAQLSSSTEIRKAPFLA